MYYLHRTCCWMSVGPHWALFHTLHTHTSWVRLVLCGIIHPSIHLLTLRPGSGRGGQQPETSLSQTPPPALPGRIPKAFPSQPSDMVTSVCPAVIKLHILECLLWSSEGTHLCNYLSGGWIVSLTQICHLNLTEICFLCTLKIGFKLMCFKGIRVLCT